MIVPRRVSPQSSFFITNLWFFTYKPRKFNSKSDSKITQNPKGKACYLPTTPIFRGKLTVKPSRERSHIPPERESRKIIDSNSCRLIGRGDVRSYPPPRMPVTNEGLYIGIPDPKNGSCHPGGDDCILRAWRIIPVNK